MTTDYSVSVSDAIADATRHQLATAVRVDEPAAPDPDAAPRAVLRALAQVAPGAAAVEAYMTVSTFRIVPIDVNTLVETRDPFTSYADAAGHYSTNNGDGAALVCGEQGDGSWLVAVTGTSEDYSAWIADVGVERRQVVDGNGQRRVDATYRNFPIHATVSWQPSPISHRVTKVAVGRQEIAEVGERMRTDRAGAGERGWICWAIPAEPGRRIRLASKELAPGLRLLASGEPLPVAGRRSDGWRLHASGVPMSVETPSWLIEALGAKVRRTS